MSVNILPALSVWQDFVLPSNFNEQIISEKQIKGVLIREYSIDGNNTENGQVKINLLTAQLNDGDEKDGPILFILKDFEQKDILSDIVFFAKKGYTVCSVDIEGKSDREFYTYYPENISYANYILAKDNLYEITNTVKESCWYEWAVVLKYAIRFCKKTFSNKKLGLIARGRSATVAWQAVANNEDVSAFVVLFNCGWTTYKGDYKFDSGDENNFNDSELAFIAGIEPQSYAQYVKCPTYIVENPNDRIFDADRAHDTLKRVVNEKKGLLYDCAYVQGIGQKSFEGIYSFINQTLFGDKRSLKLNEPNISSRIVRTEAKNSDCYIEVFLAQNKGADLG